MSSSWFFQGGRSRLSSWFKAVIGVPISFLTSVFALLLWGLGLACFALIFSLSVLTSAFIAVLWPAIKAFYVLIGGLWAVVSILVCLGGGFMWVLQKLWRGVSWLGKTVWSGVTATGSFLKKVGGGMYAGGKAVVRGIGNLLGGIFRGFNLWQGQQTLKLYNTVHFASPSLPDNGLVEGMPDGRKLERNYCNTIIYDMGRPGVADEYKVFPPRGLNDLKVWAEGGPYDVAVSNSPHGPWKECGEGRDTSEFDVPWWGSPWRYVKIHFKGRTNLDAISDLDY